MYLNPRADSMPYLKFHLKYYHHMVDVEYYILNLFYYNNMACFLILLTLQLIRNMRYELTIISTWH